MSYNVLKHLLRNSAGIGDHSTTDFYDNLDEALNILVDAEDRLEVLSKHYSDIIKQIV